MDTFYSKTFPFQSRIAWSVTEEVDINHITDLEAKYLSEIKPEPRKAQFIAGRNLIRTITGLDTDDIDYDQFGAPYFIDHPAKVISLSHSVDMVAASVSSVANGIDIQKKAEKILHIVPKFMSPLEIERSSSIDMLDFAHFTWSAKEAMFKTYRIGNVDFRKHLFPDLPLNEINDDYFECTGKLINDHTEMDFKLFCQRYLDYYLVFALKM